MSDRDPKPDNIELDVDLVVPPDQADAFDDVVLAWLVGLLDNPAPGDPA